MRRKTEILLLLTIILIIPIQQFFLYYLMNPSYGIISSDYWQHIIQMRQMDAEQIFNFNVSWSNIFRINGEYEFYPPGFTMILNSVREVTGLGFVDLFLLSTLFWMIFCILTYLIARKLTSNGMAALFAAFCVAFFISGSNMLGPIFLLSSTYGVLTILFILITMMTVNSDINKLIVCTIFVFCLFVSHRPSTGMWLGFLVLFAILCPIFVKNRQRFIHTFITPLIFSTLIGGLLSVLFWFNAPIEKTMRLGGIISKRIDVMLMGFELSKPQALGVIMIIFLVLIVVYVVQSKPLYFTREIGPTPMKKMKDYQWVLLMMTIPIVIIILMLTIIVTIGAHIPTSPSAVIDLWGDISSEAKGNPVVKIMKQLVYIWHFNLLPLAMLSPALFLVASRVRRNYYLIATAVSILVIPALLIINIYVQPVKIQRVYFYAAPFVSILVGWSIVNLIKEKQRFKKLVVIFMVVSVGLSFFSLQYNFDKESSDNIVGIYWEETTNSIDNHMATTYMGALEGRGLGQIDFTIYYSLFTITNNHQLVERLKNDGFHGIELPPPQSQLRESVSGSSTTLIYLGGGCSIWII